MDDEVDRGDPARGRPLAEAHAALAERASALATLNAVADAVHRSLDVATVGRAAIGALRAYKPLSAISILALSPDGSELTLVAADGFGPDLQRESFPIEGSLVGLAAARRTVITVDDLGSETRGLREMRDRLLRDGFRGLIVVPLIRGERVLGTMNLVMQGSDRLSDEERDTLLAAGKTIALAMDNAHHVEQLREKDLRYGLATGAARVGVWDWNLAAGSFYLDPNVKVLLGFGDAEMPNDLECWSERIHPDDRATVESAIRAHLDGKTPEFVCEHRMIHKDGSERWILARGHAMRDGHGRVFRMVGTDADVTEPRRLERERRELEQQLLHAEKLKSLGVLAGGIAHEFNNLLTAVLGNAGLAHRQCEPGSPVQRRIEQIEAAATRATDLTRQLLAYSGRGTFVLKSIDLSRLVEETAELLYVSVGRKTTLELDCPPGLPRIQGDPGQLRQLVLNLVQNASESLRGEAGRIRVAAARGPRALAARDGVVLEVSDTGCGIAEKDLKRIFEPFYTTKLSGRGLGLAAVQGIVRGHQGTLDVQSAAGRGTTVRVGLPVLEPLAAGSDTEPAADAELSGRLVLVVDDEQPVVALAKVVLEDAGCEVLTAANGSEALSTFGELADRIDLVLLDLSMPWMNGLETFRAIREISPDARIVLSSGLGASDALSELAGAGLSGFLEKPYAPDRLVEELRRALRP